MLQGADVMECEMFAAGYVRSPNNIHALPTVHHDERDELAGVSPEFYPGGPGVPCPANGLSVQVCADRIRVFRTQFFGTPYSRASFVDTVTVAVFASVADFLAWCPCVSEPGAPAYSNGGD